jgi:hypothetical protein
LRGGCAAQRFELALAEEHAAARSAPVDHHAVHDHQLHACAVGGT